MAYTGTAVVPTNAAVFIPELWSDKVIKARERNLVVAKRVMRLDDEVKSMGDTVHLPRFANVTARTKTPGTTITYDATTNGEFQLGITTQAYHGVLVEDITKVQSKYSLMDLYTEKIGYALAQKVDSDLLSVYTGHGIAQTVGVVATSTTDTIAKTYITGAKRMLDSADAPFENRYMTVDPYGYAQLFNIDDFVRYDSRGKTDLLGQATVGELYGFEVLMTNQVPFVTSVSRALIWQKDAIALAMQQSVKMVSEYSVDELGTKVAGYEIYGYGVPRTDHAVILQYGQI